MEDRGKKYFSKKSRALLGTALFVLIFSGLGLYYLVFAPDWSFLSSWRFWFNNQDEKPALNEEPPVLKEPDGANCYQRWLDGVNVESEAAAAVFPVAIVIDNDVLARPQEALSQASLVYEVPVEGGMTRYLAIFPSDVEIKTVGPIRSARPYLVSLAEEINALFIHCGGSPEALNLLNKSAVYDLNEFYNSAYFWRDQSGRKTAPHNVLTSADNWRSYLNKRGLSEKGAESWLFKKEEVVSLNAADLEDININFSLNFKATWRYEAESNSYQRFFNGAKSEDSLGPIKAKNIIIQETSSQILDEVGRLKLDMVGSGKAKICLDGACRQGTWRKNGNARTRYYYDNGEEIKLNPGVTWIEVADSNTSVQ